MYDNMYLQNEQRMCDKTVKEEQKITQS